MWSCLSALFLKAWCMFSVTVFFGHLVSVRSAFLLACWLKHAKQLIYDLCSILMSRFKSSLFFLHRQFAAFYDNLPCKTAYFLVAEGCSALACWVCVVSWLSIRLHVCLVLYSQLIGCHWHWLTLQAPSELVFLSISSPTAKVINIRLLCKMPQQVLLLLSSLITPVLLSENKVLCLGEMERCCKSQSLSSLVELLDITACILKGCN